MVEKRSLEHRKIGRNLFLEQKRQHCYLNNVIEAKLQESERNFLKEEPEENEEELIRNCQEARQWFQEMNEEEGI